MNNSTSLTKNLSIVMLAGLIAFCGCRSASGPGSASFASVVIQGRTLGDIVSTTGQVFREDGFIGAQTGPGSMVFEREASRLSTISRDGLVAAQSGARTIERVRVETVALDGDSHRLQCEAFMVTGAGDSFFENEVRMANLRSGPYRSLMNKVAKLLK